jgi:putative phage-type endonuclease
MQIHELTQGTPEWHAYRADHDNASDAPAVLGKSPYKTRAELLHEQHTGLAKEVSATVQALYDNGHRFEALARPLAEKIIGQDLYPVTGSAGRLSASFDGLTMMEDVIWEHKTLNDAIRAAATAHDLGEHLCIQMEQQMMVSGADRVLFSATLWDANDNLVEEKHLWYEGDPQLRAEIEAGWEQFAKDLAAYKPVQLADKPAAAPILQLPALVVQTKGEVVQSNLPDFKAAAEAFIANIKMELSTDEDFANAEAVVKFCGDAEKKLEVTKSAVLAQAATIDDVMRTIDNISDQLRTKRLALDKLVAKRKQEIKETILAEAKIAYADHVAALEAEIKPLRLPAAQPDFAGAMKNKRTLASLHDAVDTLLASAKISTNTTAADYRAKQAWCKEHAAGHGALFMDMATIITKPMDDFQLVITTRVSAHLAAEEKKEADMRAQIAAEEKAKAEAAAKAKADAAEAERVANERAATALADQNRQAAEAAERKRATEAAAANVAANTAPAVPAGAAAEIARTAAFYGEHRAAAPDRATQLQALADQNLDDKRAMAATSRVTGVPVATRPYPAAGAAQGALLDAADAESHPTDDEIMELGADFGLAPAEWLARLERFVAAFHAGEILAAA